MMLVSHKKICFLSIFLSLFYYSQQNTVTRLYSDFNGGWDSQTQPTVLPNNSHNVLGFTWQGTTFTTGVNDALLLSLPGTSNVSLQQYQAFPAVNAPVANSSTYIGVGTSYGGGDGNVNPVPVNNNLVQYLSDGVNGLDLGTAIFNIPSGNEIRYQIANINPASINDGVPDLVVTQVGEASSAFDVFRFVDSNNLTVGNAFNVSFSGVTAVGQSRFKFYAPSATPPTYVPNLYGPRPVRLLAFDWSDLGITTLNYTDCKFFTQRFSGTSDVAFTAYNKLSVGVLQSISGTVYNDNDAGTPNGTPYQGAEVKLFNAGNVLVNTVTTGANGVFVFPDLPPGVFRIELTVPAGFTIVGAADNNTDNIIVTTLLDVSVQNRDFGINQPPLAVDNIETNELNTPIQVNIATNDSDPNSGIVIPSAINLIPPSGATSVVMSSGLIKGFTINNVGIISVNNSGLLIFTPVNGYFGNVPVFHYTIRDNANLLSNQAQIVLRIEEYCTKSASIIVGGLPTKLGITTQQKNNLWPQNVRNGFLALESSTKGLVITRVQNSASISQPVEGMVVYDISAQCVKIYNGTSWNCITRKCNIPN